MTTEAIFDEDAFGRDDESDDGRFYITARCVDHLDRPALVTVEKIIGALVTKRRPVVLDLMAGFNSHLPGTVLPETMVGLGLNEEELEANPEIDRFVVQDLNRETVLPFPDGSFDVVLNTLSIAYLNRPFEIFPEIGRVLKTGGLLLVIFSNRMFAEKAVRVWRNAQADGRLLLAGFYIQAAACFGPPSIIVCEGDPKYDDANTILLEGYGDPVYAAFAFKKGAVSRQAPTLSGFQHARLDIARQRATVLAAALKNLGGLAEEAPPRMLVRVLGRFYKTMQEIVHRHGGRVCRFEKDTMLSLFTGDGGKGDGSDAAVACALELRDAAPAMNDRLALETAQALGIGVALSTGECVIGEVPHIRGQRYSCIGKAVAGALANADGADAGQIVRAS